MDCQVSEFDAFVRARTPALLRSAYLLTGDQHLAEDLVQSALARTHRSWHRLHDSGNAEAYTRKVMYHLQVSWWRRRRVPESMSGVLPEPRGGGSVPDHAQQTALRLTLRAALLKLSPKQRAVLTLRFFEDRTESEAADLLGVTVGTVKSQTAKALAKLRAVAPELAELYVLEGTVR
ncbi:SigE family RNA polymerase sigma factor [Micromonospora sp. NPDC050686]|uniref:SigE family RNA polymerase sigma factor n=1 Tax=Micromonospora sp. NPDC050686 TaxID=3154631 RepID=UPI0033C4AE96